MELLILFLLTIVNGILALSELAVVSARKLRLEHMAKAGNTGARAALELANHPNHFLSTVQIGITLVGIFAGAFGGATIAESLEERLDTVPPLEPYSEGISVGLVVLLTTYLSLVIGELVPKRLALQNPERVAALVAKPMAILSRISAPAVKILSVSTDVLLRLLGASQSDEPPVTEAEIRALIQQGTEAGIFEAAEHEMVAGVFSLGDQRVSAIMTPRTEITWLDLDDSDEENERKIIECPHSRLPVCRGGLDHIVGIVRAKEVLNRCLAGQPFDLAALAYEPLFVPESRPVSKVLELFKQTKRHMVLVIGEHGGVEGLVTMQDVLEEIVGDIEQALAVQREDGSWLLDGLLPMNDLIGLLQIKELPGEEEGHYETLGGFVMARLGYIPSPADHFEWNGIYFEIVDMDGRRVDKVLVQRNKP
jgi:putative hemolysin